MNPFEYSLTGLRSAMGAKKLSAIEATKSYLDRIAKHDPAIHAYHQTYADRALTQAARVDAGEVHGALAGVPIALKDNLCTSDGHTTCSSKMLANFQAPYTATVVKKLEQAGAIILGKTNMDEFAMGSSSENSACGVTRNPWDFDRVPGGSSSGSAAGMAADLCAASLGSDTGGSIRQPAALCGVIGIKPTYGRVSRYGLVAFASSLDQIGCFNRTVEDTALLLSVISGYDPLDSTSVNMPVPDYASELAKPLCGLRIGLPKEYVSDANHRAVQKMVRDALDVYRSQGATIVDITLPHTKYGIPTYYVVCTAEASSNLARFDGVRYGHRTAEPSDLIDLYSRSRAQGFGPEVQRRIMLGTYVLSSGYYDAYYLSALKVRRLIKQDFDLAFAQCDLILGPTTTGGAFKFGQMADDPLAMYMNDIYTVNCNLAGLPGLSLPGGFIEEEGKRLPIGLQLMAPLFQETRLLQAARMYEQATNYAQQKPSLD